MSKVIHHYLAFFMHKTSYRYDHTMSPVFHDELTEIIGYVNRECFIFLNEYVKGQRCGKRTPNHHHHFDHALLTSPQMRHENDARLNKHLCDCCVCNETASRGKMTWHSLVHLPFSHFRLAKEFGYDSFTPNPGWIARFKERNNLKYKKIAGEAGDCLEHAEEIQEFMSVVMPPLMAEYDPKDIFNIDETALLNLNLEGARTLVQGKQRVSFCAK